MTLSDLETPNVRNQFFQEDLNNAGYVSHVIAFAKCVARFVSDSWVSCFLFVFNDGCTCAQFSDFTRETAHTHYNGKMGKPFFYIFAILPSPRPLQCIPGSPIRKFSGSSSFYCLHHVNGREFYTGDSSPHTWFLSPPVLSKFQLQSTTLCWIVCKARSLLSHGRSNTVASQSPRNAAYRATLSGKALYIAVDRLSIRHIRVLYVSKRLNIASGYYMERYRKS